jgi:hypothetical protein
MAVGHGAACAAPDFRVFSTDGQIPNARFYFIESTAPDSVEQGADPIGEPPDGLTSVDPDDAVKEIAETLTPEGGSDVDTNLVVMVHGFNTPRDRALEFYGKALEALKSDQDKLFGEAGRRTVCIGYRWPSERIGSVLSSSVSAMPVLPLIILCVSALSIAVAVWIIAALFKLLGMTETDLVRQVLVAFIAGCVLLIFAIAILALLRAIVYFRDVYRATRISSR